MKTALLALENEVIKKHDVVRYVKYIAWQTKEIKQRKLRVKPIKRERIPEFGEEYYFKES